MLSRTVPDVGPIDPSLKIPVLDSIQDIVGELRSSKRFTIVRSPDAALLQLVVVGRRIAGQGDSYGVPIGGVFYTASVILLAKMDISRTAGQSWSGLLSA